MLTVTWIVNTTGQINVSDFVPMSKLIAKHVDPVPSSIYRLLQSVITARTATHAVFQQVALVKPDPDMETSNANHKRFIDILTDAFVALRGDTWTAKKDAMPKNEEEEESDEISFANTFSLLDLGPNKHNDDEDDDDDESYPEGEEGASTGASASTGSRKKAKSRKKSGKRGKKRKAMQPSMLRDSDLNKVPFESYRIIEDETGLMTDYLMAVYSLAQEWVELRGTLQELWRQAAYDGLNTAIAGEVSRVAVAMITQTESLIFVDFPGHDDFETVLQTITRGHIDNVQEVFRSAMHQIDLANLGEDDAEIDVDVEEQLLMHTYHALLDFLKDYRHTRTGKPSKRMSSAIKAWDPYLNLQEATKQERIQWRRAYTINWLYDLVNVYACKILLRKDLLGEDIVLETMDWSVRGSLFTERQLCGLNEVRQSQVRCSWSEPCPFPHGCRTRHLQARADPRTTKFASEITALAMQKPGTDIRHRILPHTVFELQ